MLNRRSLLKAGAMTAVISPQFHARAAQAAGEVTIGAIYPMTGSSAQVGVDARHALETAIEIVNSVQDIDVPGAANAGLKGLGGARLRLVMADHQGDPQKGRAEAERLITQENVACVIGAYHSSVSATASVVCERYGVPYIAADSSSPSLSMRGLKYFFRTTAHDEMFSTAMFNFLDAQRAAGKKIGSVGLFYEDTIFGTDSSNVQRKLATERGYRLACDIKYKANSPSLSAEVQMIKAADPDVLLPSSYTTDAILLIKTFSDLGYAPKNILAQAAGFSDKATFDAVGGKLEGLISRTSFALDLQARKPSVGKVNALFKAKAQRDLNDNSSRELMAVLVLADALDRAGSTDGARLRDALAATDIPGGRTIMPWSRVRFDASGQNEYADPALIQYIGGKFVTIYPKDVAVREVRWPMNPHV
jgi:branched-chain amino acid transport system substrate-binding protein